MIRRRCAGCDNTDEQVRSHRFPEDKSQALKWKHSLNLQEFPIELLQSKFTVCSEHFQENDYQNDEQYKENVEQLKDTAIPKLQTVAKTPTVTLENNDTKDGNDISTEICILDESHYSNNADQQKDGEYIHQLDHLIDASDFTVLHAPTLSIQQYRQSSAFDESTEVLMHSDCSEKPGHAFSGTDSDVEILLSEEIIDSDWSGAALDNLGHTPEYIQKLVEAAPITSPTSPSIKRTESTDQDISIEFSGCSMGGYEQLNRTQLINVIRNQAAHIRQLKATLQRYRNCVFEHIDSLRSEFETGVSLEEFDKSHETIN